MGRPAVANNLPDKLLAVKGCSAGICVPWDEMTFADTMPRLLKNPDWANAMEKAGRSYVERNWITERLQMPLSGVTTKYAFL